MQVDSSQKSPIKMWVNGLPEVEPEAMQQLRNLANLPFIHSHVAVMPDVHAGKGSTIGSVIATRKAIIPAAVGVDLGCFVGNTKIPLLDGTQRSLKELTKRKTPFWVYSVDTENMKLVPGQAIARKTRNNASLVKVIISGGEKIICTPDHKFMLSDGSYVEAQHLKFNDSLMPLYRKWEKRDGYERIDMGKGTAIYTHKMVWKEIYGDVPKDHVIHHKDHNHFNNDPDNLEIMTAKDHSRYHRETGNKFDNSNTQFQELRLAGLERSKSNTEITQ